MIAELLASQDHDGQVAIKQKNLYTYLIWRVENVEIQDDFSVGKVVECFGCDTKQELEMLKEQMSEKPGYIEIVKNQYLQGKPN